MISIGISIRTNINRVKGVTPKKLVKKHLKAKLRFLKLIKINRQPNLMMRILFRSFFFQFLWPIIIILEQKY